MSDSQTIAAKQGEASIDAFGHRLPLTLRVEQAARVIGISRTAMYAAIRRGDFDTIDVNGRTAVLTVPLLRRLGVDVEVIRAA